MSSQPRRIEYVPLPEIQPEPRNPRTHESIEDVKDSILRFGFADPIIHDGRTGRMLAGHGRVEALTDLHARWLNAPADEKLVPDGIMVDGDDTWLAPVVYGLSTKDDYEAAGLLIALNRHAETGGWDTPQTLSLLDEIAAEGMAGLTGVGFTDADRDALRRLVEASGEALDAAQEWADAGMPDYQSEGAEGAYRTVVHFRSEEDVEAFFKLIGRDRRKWLWWPEPEESRQTSREQWVGEDAAA